MFEAWRKVSRYVPKDLVYWCAIRLGVNATTGDYSRQVVPELTFMDALKRWELVHGSPD